MKSAVLVLFIVVALTDAASAAKHHITLANGKSFDLTLPDGFGISVRSATVEGLHHRLLRRHKHQRPPR